jgi:surface protein
VTSPVQNQAYSTGFLDCILSMPNAGSGSSIVFGGNLLRHSFLERFDIKTIGSATVLSNLFRNCHALQDIPLFDTSLVTTMLDLFANCLSLKNVPLLNTLNVSNMSFMLSECRSLQEVPLFNTGNLLNMSGMFNNCISLKSVPLFNTANVTNMNDTFFGCVSLESVPTLNTSGITISTGTNYNTIFGSCNSLNKIQLVFARQVSLTNCQLSQTALVEIFNNLVDRSSTASANINITGNWGASALTVGERAIATGKNWTITG